MKNTMIPDSIWINAHIQTMDDSLPSAQAFAVAGGRITALGTDDEILSLRGPQTEIHDLEGHFVYPGFIEGHMHLPMYGDSLLTLPVRDRSRQKILEMVRQRVAQSAPGEWIVGGMGWNNEVWDDPSYPSALELDAVAPQNPVLLPRMDGHMIWVNHRALEAAGVTEQTPDPEHGTLLGCVTNEAAEQVKAFVPEKTALQRKDALLAAQQQLLQYGVTNVNDMGTSLEDVHDLKALYESGEYKLRFHGALRYALGPDAPADEKAYLAQCPEIDLYNGHFTVRACKLLGDGAVGSQSACLKQDYSDRPGHRGVKMRTDSELYACVREAAEHGMQMIIHAIGDDTIDQVLRVYQQVLQDVPTPDHRWHIEHFQTVDGDQPERARELGVWPSMQPLHAPNSASMALRRLGPDRASRAYAGGLVLRKIGHISWGSDAPVATPSPLSGMHAAITRTNDKLLPKGGFFPENAVTPEEALLGYTRWGAEAQFTEKECGTLSVGKYADFVVLDQDLLKTASEVPDDLLKLRVLMTAIDGCPVYRAKN